MGKIVMRAMQCAALSALALLPLLAGAGQITHTANYGGRVTLGTDTLGGTTYTTVRYGRLYSGGEAGSPSLPVDYIRFSVPWNATGFTVSATGVTGETLLLDHPVYPSQSGAAVPTLQPSRAVTAHPASLAWYVSEGMFAGENHIVTVAVSPVTYRHGTGDTLSVLQSVTLTLEYELSDTPPMTPLVRRDTTLRSKGFALARSVVANPGDVKGNAATQQSIPRLIYPPGPEEPEGVPATYLIVTTDELKHSMRRLAALKKQKGINVKVVSMDEVLNDPLSGNGDDVYGNGTYYYTDDAGKLRQYLRMHYYYYGTEYVLFAGAEVPHRNNTDLYFGDLSFSWYPEKDIFNELNIGRLPFQSQEQTRYYTDKLLRYELNPGNGAGSYLKRSFHIEEGNYETYFGGQIGTFSSLGMIDTLINRGDNEICTGNNVINLINNNHYGFIGTFGTSAPSYTMVYSGNGGSRYVWAIDTVKVGPNVSDPLETGNGLNRISNKYFPMVYYSAVGQTIPFDPVIGYDVDLNYGESFVMGDRYGGPAYLGYTEDVGIYTSKALSDLFASALSSSGFNLNEAMSKARYTYNNPYYYDERYYLNMLGDPTLEMWTDGPQVYTGIGLTRTDNSIIITGIPTGKTVVAYCSNNGENGKVESTSSSVTLNNVSPNSTIMLYRHNFYPYIADLVLQNTTISESQYVIANDVIAGKSVDSGRTNGNVVVNEGVDYEIEASGTVTLNGGFQVEKGARFTIYKSEY